MQRSSSRRHTLFAHPERTCNIACATSTFIFLIPTCYVLTPLGNAFRSARRIRNDAQAIVDSTVQRLEGIEAKISETNKRIEDLSCAISGYLGFNQRAKDFLSNISDPLALPFDILKSSWQLQFAPDKNATEQFTTQKSYEDQRLDDHYNCHHACPTDSRGETVLCCWSYGYEWDTYYYDEITRIENRFKNMITGSPMHLPSLDCGSYARQFQTFSPEKLITYESKHINAGNRDSGKTYVNFFRNYGSGLKVSFSLDDKTTDLMVKVVRNVTAGEAAVSLVANLQDFLSYAIAAFNMAGANYPLLRDGYRNVTSTLLTEAAAVNETLRQQLLVSAEKQTLLDVASDEYQNGLNLWLPMLFLLPPAIGLLLYTLISLGKNFFDHDDSPAAVALSDDLENQLHVELIDPPPAYTSRRM